jgi:RHS repeat-associated protein
VQDAATGLTYMQQRYYDPLIGRFLSVDPVTAYSSPAGNFNRYWYANNNPYRFYDPDGRCTGSRIKNKDGTCKSTGGFTTQSGPGAARSLSSVLGMRAKTPSSQAKLIESVGGDPKVLENAREAHESFATTLITFFAGGGLGGARQGTTTLYRAVSEAEAASIRATGKFSVGPN